MAKQKKDDTVKRFSLSTDEKTELKRILTTIAFFRTAIEGMQFSLQIKQQQIELTRAIGKAPDGYRIETKIDMEAEELLVRKVKIELPKEVEKEPPKEEEKA